ncbi:hypothetical protein BUALT_Bualt07G0110100 [Buddleja alternifolia]|uniref:Uncharacterized protein n=1 Tax=Buddleja alternifolia TaxID=168488 RepID=A0AAV6X9Z3_9LAMI|nr:hypothetical protein BUALT_Bualt07G0110100 [Buddleja alternifolia]
MNEPIPITQPELINLDIEPQTKAPYEHILQTEPQTQPQTQSQTDSQTQHKTLEVKEDGENLEGPEWDEICRIIDSTVLGYLSEDAVGNGDEKETENGTENGTGKGTEMGTEMGTKMVEREPSSDSEGEESEDLVNGGDNFSSGKDSDNEGGAENRFCGRHLHENFKKARFRGLAFKLALWNAAKATTLPEYELRMKEMGLLDESVVEWFNNKPPSQWIRSHFQTFPKCDMLLNNLCESFNSSILEAREKPILTMLEWIREYLMITLTENRNKAKKR